MKKRTLLISFLIAIVILFMFAINQKTEMLGSIDKPSLLSMMGGPLQAAQPLQTSGPMQPAGPLQAASPLQMMAPLAIPDSAQGSNTSLQSAGNLEVYSDFLDGLDRLIVSQDGTSYELLPVVVGNLLKFEFSYTPQILAAAVDKITSITVTPTPGPGFNPIPPPTGLPPIFIPNQNQASPR